MADSIVKDIYTDVKAALDTLTEIDGANIDLYKNQVALLTNFPTVLIDFPYIYYKDHGAKIQMGNTMVRLMLCVDVTTLTGAGVTDVFELKDKIYAAVQGVRKILPMDPDDKPKYAPLTRGTERTETKYIDGDTGPITGIYVFEMDFYTLIQDDGVYRYKTLVDASPATLKMGRGVIAAEVGGVNDGVEQGIVNKIDNDIIRTGKIV